MYYNMRMKTLKLYGTNIIKRGIEVHSKKVDYIQQTLDSLNRLQKVHLVRSPQILKIAYFRKS